MARPDEARHTIATAMRINPENERTHADKGWIELNNNNRPLAEKHFREALRINPNNQYAEVGLKRVMDKNYGKPPGSAPNATTKILIYVILLTVTIAVMTTERFLHAGIFFFVMLFIIIKAQK
jgi:tetratricopeptide (TPR) repeat protein